MANVDNTSDLNKPISTATQTALNAKQDTLTLTTTGTSGASTLVGNTLNIPQYSGGGGGGVTSVTGTAPVVSSGGTTPAISMPAATTSVNGYLSSADWTTFNNKQATLVSATNIKTINGNSILGSGNLVVSGGGGTTGGPHFIVSRGASTPTTSLKTNGKAPTTCTTATNRMTLMPFVPNNTFGSNATGYNISFKVNVVTASAINFKILVFTNTSGRPLTKLYEGPSISCATTGVKEIISTLTTLPVGSIYWIGTITSAAGATLTQYSPDSMTPISENTSLTSESFWFLSATAYAYASVPATVTGSLFTEGSINCPAVYLNQYFDI